MVMMNVTISVALEGDESQLDTIRDFRDNVLAQTPAGQEIIRLYYQLSPAIVRAMVNDEKFKECVREQIDGILPLVEETVDRFIDLINILKGRA